MSFNAIVSRRAFNSFSYIYQKFNMSTRYKGQFCFVIDTFASFIYPFKQKTTWPQTQLQWAFCMNCSRFTTSTMLDDKTKHLNKSGLTFLCFGCVPCHPASRFLYHCGRLMQRVHSIHSNSSFHPERGLKFTQKKSILITLL